MMPEWRCAELLLIGTLTFTSGCSLALVDGPPEFIPADQPLPAGACTIDRTLPFMDAIGAGTLLFVAATSSRGDRVRFGAVLGGALGYSGYSGFRSVRRCRERMLLRPDPPPSPDTTLPRSREPHHLLRTRPGESGPAGTNG